MEKYQHGKAALCLYREINKMVHCILGLAPICRNALGAQNKIVKDFNQKYALNRLVWYERYVNDWILACASTTFV